jgi:choice-of-anchor C domain-containing protein
MNKGICFIFLTGALWSAELRGAELFHSGFESPSAGDRYTVLSQSDSVDGWTVEAGTIEIVGTYWLAAEGNQSIDLSGIFDLAGTIYRDVPTVPGNSYVLKFAFAGNPADAAIKEAKVFWDGGEVADLTADTHGRTFTDMGWNYYQYTLKATNEVTRIKFQSLTLNALGPVIDDVSLSDVVEPPPPVTLTANMFAGVWLEGPAGTRQQLQYTTDAGQQSGWTTLITVKLPPEGKLFFLDPEPATTEKRFYRTIAAP